mgnify:CR=1 FL=1
MGKRKKLSKEQLRANIIFSIMMFAVALIVLAMGIWLIRTITGADIPDKARDAEESRTAQVISIPEPQLISKPEESSEESSLPEESSNAAEESSDMVSAESSEEESSEEEVSVEESVPPVTNEYFADAVFIGNSLTEGLFMYTDIDDQADGFYTVGLNVSSAQSDAFVDDTYTLDQALVQKDYRKIYVMMGLNEVGWPDVDSFISEYASLLHQVERDCPEARIYVQSILPVSAARSSEGDSINNSNIRRFNEKIREMAESNNWTYLNVWEAIADEDGELPSDAAPDGVHFGPEYMEIWLQYLREHVSA